MNKTQFILASADANELFLDLIKQIAYYRNQGYNIKSNEELLKKYAVANRFDTKEVIFIKRMLQMALPEDLRKIISSNLFAKYINVSEEAFSQELYMNLDQIEYMSKNGMHMGIHGHGHYWLGDLDEDKVEQDILTALTKLDGVIDRNNWSMCYPSGSYNDSVIKIIKNLGCQLAFSTEVQIANIKSGNRYALPRLDTNDYPPKSLNYKNIEEAACVLN